MNITLLENHWYDATFSPSARFGRDEGEEEHGGERIEVEPVSASGGRNPAAMLAPFVVVAGVAAGVVAARRIQARRTARADELRQIEVDAIEYANAIDE